MGTIGIFSFAFCAVLLFILLRDENYLREIDALKEQNSAIQAKSHLNEMRTRTYQEIQHLVHDLKSPLTVVQTLVGAVSKENKDDLEKLKGYFNTVIRDKSSKGKEGGLWKEYYEARKWLR